MLVPAEISQRATPQQHAEQQVLLDDLYTYPLRSYRVVFLWWLFTGFVGGHRFYLNDVRRGALMTLTLGGGILWWLFDGLKLRSLLNDFNNQQMHRRTQGLPPLELDFMPTLNSHVLNEAPVWQAAEQKIAWQRELIQLVLIGLIAGKAIQTFDSVEPIAAVSMVALLLLFAGQLEGLRHLRIVQELLQWDLKLQLYYHQNGPGKPAERIFRPFVGLFTLLFQEKRAAEARLYLEVCFVYATFFTVYSVVSGEYYALAVKGEYTEMARTWFTETVLSLFMVYTCVSPLGATLIKYKLMHTPLWKRIVVVVVMGLAIYLGISA